MKANWDYTECIIKRSHSATNNSNKNYGKRNCSQRRQLREFHIYHQISNLNRCLNSRATGRNGYNFIPA